MTRLSGPHGDLGGFRPRPAPIDRLAIDGAEVAAWVFRGESLRIEVGRDSAGLSAAEAVILGRFLVEAAESLLTGENGVR